MSLMAIAVACQSAAHRSTDDREVPIQSTVDTVRGTLSLVGSEPGVELVLRPANGNPYAVIGGQLARLRALGKVEVMLAGRLTALKSMTASPMGLQVFEADKFVVRSADGIPAYDGTIALEGGKYVLISASGRRWPVDHLPVALRSLVGSRVFLAGPLDRDPVSYGVIAEGR